MNAHLSPPRITCRLRSRHATLYDLGMRIRAPTSIHCAALLLSACIGCGVPPAPSPPAPVAAIVASPRPAETVFRLARVPFKSARSLYEGHERFLAALAEALGVDRVELVTGSSYQDVMDRLETGGADAAWVGTMAYVEAVLRHLKSRKPVPYEPILCPIRNGRSSYQGVIFAHAAGGMTELKNLKGKRIAFVDPDSASGFIFARWLIEAAGVRVPDDLVTRIPGEPDFLLKHDAVVSAVYLQKFDAGAVFDDAIDETFQGPDASKRKELVVLGTTEMIPNEPIVIMANLPVEKRDRIVRSFLQVQIPEAIRADLSGVSGFAPVGPDKYQWMIERRSKNP